VGVDQRPAPQHRRLLVADVRLAKQLPLLGGVPVGQLPVAGPQLQVDQVGEHPTLAADVALLSGPTGRQVEQAAGFVEVVRPRQRRPEGPLRAVVGPQSTHRGRQGERARHERALDPASQQGS
jgi:hypothetical protein